MDVSSPLMTDPQTILTAANEIEMDIPHNRLATFDPRLVAKYQRRMPGFDDHVISMYARGTGVREIPGHLLSFIA